MKYRHASLLRIALANSIGFSASTAVPLWVGSVGPHFGFPSWGAGAVATGQLTCAALLNAMTPWLFRGTHPRSLALLATAVALLGNGLAWLGSTCAFIAGCLLGGAGFGVLLNVTNRLVAGSSVPQRGYATVQLVEVVFCIGFFLSVPPILERFGTLSVFAALAVLCAAVFPLLAGLPVAVSGGAQVVARKNNGSLPNTVSALLSLCAAALLFAGYSAVSASLVSIGAAAGLSLLWVGRIMALGLLASLGGAVLARGLSERIGVLLPLLAGAGIVGGDMLVLTMGRGPYGFIGGSLLLFMGMVFLSPYIYTLLAELDKNGRWASIAPGFILTGVAFGPGIAGLVTRGGDFKTLGITALTCIAAAMALFVSAQRLRSPAAPAGEAQPEPI